MKSATIYLNKIKAAKFIEHNQSSYELEYDANYKGNPVSLTLPIRKESYLFNRFPPFFEGLLSEGIMLEALLRTKKIDRNDLFSQLMAVGQDLVGHVTVEKENE